MFCLVLPNLNPLGFQLEPTQYYYGSISMNVGKLDPMVLQDQQQTDLRHLFSEEQPENLRLIELRFLLRPHCLLFLSYRLNLKHDLIGWRVKNKIYPLE